MVTCTWSQYLHINKYKCKLITIKSTTIFLVNYNVGILILSLILKPQYMHVPESQVTPPLLRVFSEPHLFLVLALYFRVIHANQNALSIYNIC